MSRVLEKLEQYAQEFLDEDGYQKLKQNRSQITNQLDTSFCEQRSNMLLQEALSRSKKKRLKKKQKKILKTSIVNDVSPISNKNEESTESTEKNKNKTVQKLINELDLANFKPRETKDPSCQEELNGSSQKRKPEVIIFCDPSKKKKKVLEEKEESLKPEKHNTNSPQFNMKKSRYEIIKFGITGFQKDKATDAKVALAIKLGAKPPKNKYVNYKELLEQKKLQRIKENEDQLLLKKMGLSVKNSTRKQRIRDKNAVRGFDYQIGKYKDGVQFVSKKELHEKKKKF